MISSSAPLPSHGTATMLVRRLSDELVSRNTISSMSTSIYDTAWVSMIAKEVNGVTSWLFPEAFQYLLDNQLPDGGWKHSSTQTDGILHGLAAILAMQKHSLNPEWTNCPLPVDLDLRIKKSMTVLENMLKSWDVEASQQVGFEVLVPALLAMLERYDVKISFPGKSGLLGIYHTKMERFTPEIIYSSRETTLIHSLEAFVDKIDYDQVRHRVVDGSMMASPASTAAYLIHSSSWDYEAELYLRETIHNGSGLGLGGVPSAFPSSVFELSWILSTLLEGGFSKHDLGTDTCEKLGAFLETELDRRGGTLGFAPGVMSDADDTARTILTLSLLGVRTDCQAMIKTFELRSWFMTYPGERDPSFSANCNILNTLLHVSDMMEYQNQIVKILIFLCNLWDKGSVKDKWNISIYYPIMLLSQCIHHLFKLLEAGHSFDIPPNLVETRLPIIFTQILTKLLREQEPDGSWGTRSSHEETAYALIALKCVSSTHWTPTISSKAEKSILKATAFLEQRSHKWRQADYLWIEKVTYCSPDLSQAYCMAALRFPSPQQEDTLKSFPKVSLEAIEKYKGFFHSLPLFRDTPEWLLQLSITESFIFRSQLKNQHIDIFPQRESHTQKYLDYIPITWVAINNTLVTNLDNNSLYEMMELSIINFQADEYMEATITPLFQDNLKPIRDMIISFKTASGTQINGDLNSGFSESMKVSITQVREVLSKFISHIMEREKVQQAPTSIQQELRASLITFLLAHISQIEDNKRLHKQSELSSSYNIHALPQKSYFNWVSTTSAEHTSCPFSFLFFQCMISSKKGRDTPHTSRQKYLLDSICRHLATMCRQYNDYGSVARDHAEGNLNSVDFLNGEVDAVKKQDLMWLAEYEREHLVLALTRLNGIITKEVMEKLRLFIDVTDLYGQIYVAKDIGIWTKA